MTQITGAKTFLLRVARPQNSDKFKLLRKCEGKNFAPYSTLLLLCRFFGKWGTMKISNLMHLPEHKYFFASPRNGSFDIICSVRGKRGKEFAKPHFAFIQFPLKRSSFTKNDALFPIVFRRLFFFSHWETPIMASMVYLKWTQFPPDVWWRNRMWFNGWWRLDAR